jgi:hypothetical protein
VHKYTPKEIRFIESKSAGHSNAELTGLFNKRFKTSISLSAMQSVCFCHGISVGVKYHKYTPKEIKFLESKVTGRTIPELTALFNKRFGLSITESQIMCFMSNHKLRNGRDCRFRPGQTPFNKGKKKWWTGGEETRFKPGHTPANHRPVGSKRINVDGYLEVKIAEPNKWKGKHVVIWEAANGKVPKGKAIIFADGNRLNLKLENLLMVSRAELAVMNRWRLIYPDTDMTKIGKTIADIKIKISERKKGMKKRKKSLAGRGNK